MNPPRIPRKRDYVQERASHHLALAPSMDHPLLTKRVNNLVESGNQEKKEIVNDPLTILALDPLSSVLDDPLSVHTVNMDNQTKIIENEPKSQKKTNVNDPVYVWNLKKQIILQEYTTSKNIQVLSKLLQDATNDEDEIQTKVVDRSKGQIEQFNEGKGKDDDMVSYSQKDLTTQIERIHSGLQRAWERDERVVALKLAIQCAKLLGDTLVPVFYPSMFIMVTDVLDTFGQLVFERIRKKSRESDDGISRGTLRENFTSAEVSPEAKETCRNWFYKTACIRELLPRLLIEIALLKCYRFLSDDEYPQILARIGSTIRGVGDPLVGIYCRCYLAKEGSIVAPTAKSYAITMLYDYLYSFREFKEQKIAKSLDRHGLTEAEYARLHSPAVEYLIRMIGINSGKDVFTTVLQHYRDYCGNAMVLHHIITCFPSTLYVQHSLAFVALVKESTSAHFSTVQLFTALGNEFIKNPPPEEQRLSVLNEVWKCVTKCNSFNEYISCAATWLQVLLNHYTENEALVMLKDLSKHIEVATPAEIEKSMRDIEFFVNIAISQTPSSNGQILTSDHLIKILDVFKPHRKVEVCKDLLSAFAKTHPTTSDPILINTLLEIARTLHESVDSLSPENERRYISKLINGFIDKIDFGRDLEQQLNTYVDCRAAFANLDMVLERLVLGAAGLAMKAHSFVHGNHTRRTSAFVKACLAYCHITIPSISDIFQRLNLLLLCAQIALVNQCLPQTDTLFKSAVSLIPEIPEFEEIDYKRVHTETHVAQLLRSFMSSLAVVPGHPEHGPFYLVMGMINALKKFEWQENTGAQIGVLISLLPLLATFAQRKLPYSIENVESNDSLYGGSSEYMEELQEHLDSTLLTIITELTKLGEGDDKSRKVRQIELILDFLNQLGNVMEVTPESVPFLTKLVDLVLKNKDLMSFALRNYYNNTISWLKRKTLEWVEVSGNTEELESFNLILNQVV